MSKREFPKGTLIRKKTASGVPVGAWLRIEVSNSHYVYAHHLVSGDIVLLQRKNVYKPTISQLCISNEAMDRILKGGIVISHALTNKWKKLLDTPTEIVVFYTQDGWKKAWCTVDTIKMVTHLRQRTVRIVIDRIIYRQPLL